MPEEKTIKDKISEVVGDSLLAPPELTDNSTTEISEDVDVEEAVPEIPYVRPKNANVQLAPSKQDKALNEGITNVGRVSLVLPNKQAQIGGFFAEKPNVLINQYPQFKYIDKEKKVDKTKKEGE